MNRLSVLRILNGERDPSAPLAWHEGQAVAVAAFRNDVSAVAAHVRRIGCRRGLLAAQDGYWAAVGLLALLYAGATVVVPQNLQPAGFGTTSWDIVLTDRPGSLLAKVGSGQILPLRRAELGGPPLSPLNPDAAVIEIFTAGSTGKPKAVAKTLSVMELEAATVEQVLGRFVPSDAPVLGTVPLHHLYGLTFRLFWPLATGRPLFGTTYDFWETLTSDLPPGAALITSPAHLTRIAVPARAPAEAPTLVLSAGAPLPESAAAISSDLLGTAVTEIYGSTETGVIAWRRRDRPDPGWSAFPGVAIRTDEDGRLFVQSPLLDSADVDAEGWYRGADLAEMLAANKFRLRGRADDVVKIEGKRVSLLELEQRLTAHPLVREAAVVVLNEGAVELGAAVALNSEGAAELSRIGAFRLGRLLRGYLAEAQDASGLPRRWRFVPALPTSTLGKRRRADSVALFDAAETPEPGSPVRTSEPDVRGVQRADDGTHLELYIPATLAQLEGHFPSVAIVPGVVQIDWAVTFARLHLNIAIETARSFQVKFRRVMCPGTTVTLVLRHRVELQRIDFTYRSGTDIHSSGSLSLRPAP